MDFILNQYFFETIAALFVAGFTWGFKSWASAIRTSTDAIIKRLDSMARDVHGFRIESTEAFARLDERVKALENYNSRS